MHASVPKIKNGAHYQPQLMTEQSNRSAGWVAGPAIAAPRFFVQSCVPVARNGETEVNVGAGSALVTMNVLTFEVPPAAASLTTVTAALAAAAICAAVTWAVNCVAESNVVSIAVPFHNTFAVGAKFVPVMVNWKLGWSQRSIGRLSYRRFATNLKLLIPDRRLRAAKASGFGVEGPAAQRGNSINCGQISQ
jgi:hypothetical protein